MNLIVFIIAILSVEFVLWGVSSLLAASQSLLKKVSGFSAG
jgi:hypothetical protein